MLDIKGLYADIKVKPSPKATGEITQSAVTTELLKQGIPVSLPIGDNQRYDLIFETKGQLWKAQIKTLYRIKGQSGYQFNTASVRVNSVGYVKTNYIGTADVFLMWTIDYPLNLYCISTSVAPNKGAMRLTFTKPKGKIRHNWHEDYYFNSWIEAIKDENEETPCR
jgi:hypothetical protein